MYIYIYLYIYIYIYMFSKKIHSFYVTFRFAAFSNIQIMLQTDILNT